MKPVLNSAEHDSNTEQTVYLVEEQHNPSTDFFIIPALTANKIKTIIRCNFKTLPHADELTGATVIFVRYIAKAWVKLIDKVRSKLRALIIFIDDDVFCISSSVGMSLKYRFKLARLSAWRYSWLRKQQAQLWVSTYFLQNKYCDWQPQLVLPSPVTLPCHVVRVFYHGTASHHAEIRWLRPVIIEVLKRNSHISFEIVGGDEVYQLYRGLDRVTVVHPMKWPAYQCFLSAEKRHIGLAPLLNTPFNRARSYAKIFGIHHCGAVGIYSDNGVFSKIIHHGVDGLIVPMEQSAWVSAILQLVENPELRESLFDSASLNLTRLIDLAQSSYRDLL